MRKEKGGRSWRSRGSSRLGGRSRSAWTESYRSGAAMGLAVGNSVGLVVGAGVASVDLAVGVAVGLVVGPGVASVGLGLEEEAMVNFFPAKIDSMLPDCRFREDESPMTSSS